MLLFATQHYLDQLGRPGPLHQLGDSSLALTSEAATRVTAVAPGQVTAAHHETCDVEHPLQAERRKIQVGCWVAFLS